MAILSNGSGVQQPSPAATEGERTVIIGAGIIGCATAYYLATSGKTAPRTIHIVEASPELFASASGKAGGFCTSDWFGPPTASLGRLSFALHQELADQHNGYDRWGYRRSTASSFTEEPPTRSDTSDDWLTENGSRAAAAGFHAVSDAAGGPRWLTNGRGSENEMIGEVGGTAQVDPMRLSRFLLQHSIGQGVQLHLPAKPVGIKTDTDGTISALRIQESNGSEQEIACSRLLIAAGAWTRSVFSTLFPKSPVRVGIDSLAGYSLVVKSPRWAKGLAEKDCHAIFTSMRGGISPEIFSRFGGEDGENEIYIAGLNDANLPLPELANNADVDDASVAELHTIAQRLLGTPGSKTSDLQILRKGLCFRPVTQRGVPILAKVPAAKLGSGISSQKPSTAGVYIAAGHGPWGISHSLGTGKVMAEMLEGVKELSADVRKLGLQ